MPKVVRSYDRYPGDYAMQAINFCSLASQGLWARLEDLMHTSERYGYLTQCGKAMETAMVARRVGISLEEYTALLEELEEAGWIVREKRTEIIFSEALVAQEQKRNRSRKRLGKHGHSLNGERTEEGTGSGSGSLLTPPEGNTPTREASVPSLVADPDAATEARQDAAAPRYQYRSGPSQTKLQLDR